MGDGSDVAHLGVRTIDGFQEPQDSQAENAVTNLENPSNQTTNDHESISRPPNALPIRRNRLGRSPSSTLTMAEAAVGCRGLTSEPLEAGNAPEKTFLTRLRHGCITFGQFVGPGFMIAVAYIDPGNYATDIAAGASYRFSLLFIVLMSNLFAVFLQSLCIKLGTVSGLNLAEASRAFLPRWLNWLLYGMAEVAIIATDMAEVIGTAIAINLLIPQIPLVAGCAISVMDVMIILIFYRPTGTMRGLRAFETFVVMLVLAVVVCFCIQMSLIRGTSVGEVFRGYLPSRALVEQQGLYQACGILGATVMPHSLYLGSGIVQSRLRHYDETHNLLPVVSTSEEGGGGGEGAKSEDSSPYLPSLAAIRHSLKYSISELAISLFTFALFINSAILIVAGAALYGNQEAEGADIFGVHQLLSQNLGTGAGTIFAVALLFSGISAGIVCTIAGQMVSEGALNWSLAPWLRRLITRSISIVPSIIIAGAVGREGLDAALTGSQVVLSTVLPFSSAPLIYFTCMNKYMTVQPGAARQHVPTRNTKRHARPPAGTLARRADSGVARGEESATEMVTPEDLRTQESAEPPVKMANSLPIAIIAVLIWLVISGMNIANLVLIGQNAE